MWAAIARKILRNRVTVITVIGVITVFMGYNARKAEIIYEMPRLLPDSDSTIIAFEKFRSLFGEDGVVMVIGIADDNLFELSQFNDWYDLGDEIKSVEGVKSVVSIAGIQKLIKDDSLGKIVNELVVKKKPQSQLELDSLKEEIHRLPFYDGIIYNDTLNASLMAITFDNEAVNTKKRFQIVDNIQVKVDKFLSSNDVEAHYSGMPYIRTHIARKIQHEMGLFMLLAFVVTGVILYLFFKSRLPVLFSLLVIVVGVIWSFGILVLAGYKISALTGLTSPLLIVIGVPNCILLLNKYHAEYSLYGNKIRALTRSIEKVGVSLFLANVTTAIGFAVFCSTDNQLLFEFGFVSSASVVFMYIVSLLLVPVVFSFLPPPSTKHTKHLDSKYISKFLENVDYWVHNYRKRIYGITILVLLVSVFGISKLIPLGYVVDDLPANDPVLMDVKYFEKNYNGVLPFEISIDTKRPNGVFESGGRTLYKIKKLQKLFGQYPQFSKPVSVVEGIKFANQAMHDGKKKHYRLPGASGLQRISDFAGSDLKNNKGQFSSFIDSTGRYTRVSIQMMDVGSIEMKRLAQELKPRVDTIFNYNYASKQWAPEEKQYDVAFTGTSFMFLNGNDFLVHNLLESVLLAILLISVVMYTMFMSPKMIFVSVIPSLVPLAITAGLMGYFDIYLKPSTVLTFSIAFGIASDGTLYFLTKYRQEYKSLKKVSISKAVSLTIKETGVSMVYTAIILFCGFSIFSASSFGGTAALGILISGTLLVAYCSNLILLPCFLLSLEKRLTDKEFLQKPLIEFDDDENG